MPPAIAASPPTTLQSAALSAAVSNASPFAVASAYAASTFAFSTSSDDPIDASAAAVAATTVAWSLKEMRRLLFRDLPAFGASSAIATKLATPPAGGVAGQRWWKGCGGAGRGCAGPIAQTRGPIDLAGREITMASFVLLLELTALISPHRLHVRTPRTPHRCAIARRRRRRLAPRNSARGRGDRPRGRGARRRQNWAPT